MFRGDGWHNLVPDGVIEVIEECDGVKRTQRIERSNGDLRG